MRLTRHVILAIALCGGAAAASASSAYKNGPSLQDRQQAACYNDVQKLCANAVPDVDKVTSCMADKRSQVSAKCSAMWDAKE